VPDPHHDILTSEEVVPFFTALAPKERPIFAAAIFTGLRKSELCGLLKTDDLAGRRITVCRSYGRPWPKGRKKRVVRIATELVPFLEYTLEALPGLWLFPDRKGRMHTPNWKPEKLLRTALRRAGIVTGFVHVCCEGRRLPSRPSRLCSRERPRSSARGSRDRTGRSGSPACPRRSHNATGPTTTETCGRLLARTSACRMSKSVPPRAMFVPLRAFSYRGSPGCAFY